VILGRIVSVHIYVLKLTDKLFIHKGMIYLTRYLELKLLVHINTASKNKYRNSTSFFICTFSVVHIFFVLVVYTFYFTMPHICYFVQNNSYVCTNTMCNKSMCKLYK